MTTRALLLAGVVLPVGILPHAASGSVLQVPQFAAPAPVLMVQADISAERLAARDRYETALKRWERAREVLRDAERAGSGLDAEQIAAEEAEEELAEARRALVEFVMYDVPRTALEEQALRDERAAQDDLTVDQAKSQPESRSDGLAGRGVSETPRPDEAGEPAEQSEPPSESVTLEEADPEDLDAAAEDNAGEAAGTESELASSPSSEAEETAPDARAVDKRSIDPGLRRDERRRAAVRNQQPESADTIAGETAISDQEAAEPSSSETPSPEEQVTGGQIDAAENIADAAADATEATGPAETESTAAERIREERRAAAEQSLEVEPSLEQESADSAEQEALSDSEERAASDEAPRPSQAERLMGIRGEVTEESERREESAEAGDLAAEVEGSGPGTGPDGVASGTERDRPGREERRPAAEQLQGPAGEDAGTDAAARNGDEVDPSTDPAGAEAEQPGLLQRLFGGSDGNEPDEADVAESDAGVAVTGDEANVPVETTGDNQARAAADESEPSVDRDGERAGPGLTREERRRIREERRAEAEQAEGERAESDAERGDLLAGEEQAADDQARQPSIAERLMGRRSDGADGSDSSAEALRGDDQVARAELPAAAEEADEDRLEADRPERGMTREERRRLREERRAAQEGRGAEPMDSAPGRQADTEQETPGERLSLAERMARNRALDGERILGTADGRGAMAQGQRSEDVADTVTVEELQERRRERREARRERLEGRGDTVALNQIFQNQTTINQNQTTVDQSLNTNQTIIDQSVSEQTVQQQQVIEERRGMAADAREARPSPLERIRRREERTARLEAEGRERELRGELSATRRELDRMREKLGDARLRQGDEVIRREPDRIIVRRGSEILVLRGDNENRFGLVEDVERFANGYVRTVAVRGGIRIVTLYDPEGGIMRRSRILPDGQEMVLIDAEPAMRHQGRRQLDLPPVIFEARPREVVVETRRSSTADVEIALAEPPVVEPPRAFTLEEVRYNEEIRDLVPRVDLDTITFEFDSAVIPDDQLITLEEVGIALEDILFESPNEVFLIEGHTDAPGSDIYNLALSDRRAEEVAIALSQNFDVPPENLVTQGYGEAHLKIPTIDEERQNRRVSVRRITDLVNTVQAQ